MAVSECMDDHIMILHKLAASIVGVILSIGPAYAGPSVATAHAPAPEIPYKKEYTTNEVRYLVDVYAKKYAISPDEMALVVWNESHFIYDREGDFRNSVPTSFGACQIHLPAHPSISKDQANDPHFCLDFMANKIADGQGRLWTAYRTCILKEEIVHNGKKIVCTPIKA